jgi:threonyl-tRNA synthetase
MVHRALMGSVERFLGVLIEHFGGAFPFWLAPVQAVVIPISTHRHLEYARRIVDRLRAAGIRAEVDERAERMQAKIREARMQKVPYLLIAGDREQEAGTVSVGTRGSDDQLALPLEMLLSQLHREGQRPDWVESVTDDSRRHL